MKPKRLFPTAPVMPVSTEKKGIANAREAVRHTSMPLSRFLCISMEKDLPVGMHGSVREMREQTKVGTTCSGLCSKINERAVIVCICLNMYVMYGMFECNVCNVCLYEMYIPNWDLSRKDFSISSETGKRNSAAVNRRSKERNILTKISVTPECKLSITWCGRFKKKRS